MPYRVKLWTAVFITAVIMLLASSVSSDRDIRPEAFLRLHIQANSDTDLDQALKLEVRDYVLRELRDKYSGFQEIQECLLYTGEHLPELSEKVSLFLQEKGNPVTVRGSLLKEEFPATAYGELELPPGSYWALRLTLGEGKGHNWWCVLYPPLCLQTITAGQAVPALAGQETGKPMDKGIFQKLKGTCLRQVRKVWLSQ